jgi:hypothetical protein
MNAVLKGSLILAAAVGLISIITAAMGLHASPMTGLVQIVLFILLNVGTVVWVLRQSADQNSYVQQLLNSLYVGLFAGLLIFAFSFLMLTVIFPDYLDEMRAGSVEMLEASGLPEDQIDQQIARMEGSTPASQSFAGTLGTLVTSVVVGGVAGIFLRRK